MRRAEAYNLPFEMVTTMAQDCVNIQYNLVKSLLKRSDAIFCEVAKAAQTIQAEREYLKTSCWECCKPCKEVFYKCTGCNIANYCGKKCQKKAWRLGHKAECQNLPGHYFSFVSSLKLAGLVSKRLAYPDLSLADEFLDIMYWGTTLFSADSKPCDIFKEMKGPSLHYYYSNLHRIQSEGWWLLDLTAVKQWKAHFHFRSQFDFAETELQVFKAVKCVLLFNMDAIASARYFNGEAACYVMYLCRRMSRQRFLDLYEEQLKTSYLKNPKGTIRQQKKALMANFRKAYHR